MAAATFGARAQSAKRDFKISLAGWSLHRTIGAKEGQTPMLEMPRLAREEFGIEAIELVSPMLADYRKPFGEMKPYLDTLAKNADDHNVKILLIMVDREGSIGDKKERMRDMAVERHTKWIDVAEYLGCHSIRMNWAGASRDVHKDPAALKDFIERSVPHFRKLCDHGDKRNISVIIENHGGASSYPDAMSQLMEAVDHERFGTLPDFGNFPDDVNKYEAVDALMKYAKAVSAKCYDFSEATGLETTLDFERFIQIAVDKHGYHGYIGIEFEGGKMSEFDGIKAAKKLLVKLRGGAVEA